MTLDKSFSWTMPTSLDFSGKTAAVIGGTGGIGRAFARLLAERGARVVIVGRQLRDPDSARIEFILADLSLMSEARRIGRALPAEPLDLVIFTTGIMAGPKREITREGIERDLAVSYLSRLVILRDIAPRMGSALPAGSRKPRIFVMGFPGSGQKATLDDLNSERSYGRMSAHMNTVAGNEALALDAAVRYPNVDVFGLNPGFVSTGIRSNLFGGKTWLYHLIEGPTSLLVNTADQYAERIAPLFLAPGLTGRSGAMFDDKARRVLPSRWLDSANTARLISASERLADIKNSGVDL
jgi:NAD(P)-dependent dehydrogenase (short-subunit alcohol dehydrogenase family)